MKRLFLLFALLFVVVPAVAQNAVAPGFNRITLFNYLTYADSDADTSATIVIPYDRITFRARVTDSADVIYNFDYRTNGLTTWSTATAAVGDTLTTTTNTGTYYQITIRDNATDRVPGVSTQFRVRAAFKSSKNGTTSARHYGYLEYK